MIQQYCENYAINVILSSYISKAKKDNIEVTCQTAIPKELALNHFELGLIFSNALENAIISCRKIENDNDKKISIICKERYDQLFIQISNPFLGEVIFDGGLPVSKEENHGLGTRSIATIVEKNSGVFSFTAENGIFKTTVILNCR